MSMKDRFEKAACISLQVNKYMNINVSRQIVSGHLRQNGLIYCSDKIMFINNKTTATIGRPSIMSQFAGVLQKGEKLFFVDGKQIHFDGI